MIADQQEKGAIGREPIRAPNRVSIAQRSGLFDERQSLRVIARGVGIRGLIAGADHDTNLVDACLPHLFEDDLQDGLGSSVAIHQRLQREGPLSPARRRNNRLFDFHG